MNYADLNKTIIAKVMAAIGIINNPEVAPDVRQLNQEILLREVGKSVYDKVYDMNAFDMGIENTKGEGMGDSFYGMAKVASDSISAGGKSGLPMTVKNYLDNVAGTAQRHATKTAKETGNRPRVTRISDGEACDWCDSMAGSYTNPPAEVFRRHRGCNCQIRTEGYKTRNGLLNNYTGTPRSFEEPKAVEQSFALDKVKTMNLKQRNAYVEKYLEKASPTVAQMAKDWDFSLQFQTFDHLTWEDAADPDLVAKYVKAFQKGDKFPPIVALNFAKTNAQGMTTNNFTILDGRHRIEAMKQLGAKGVPVLVGDLKGRFNLSNL
jgi:hypothetical protein